MTDTPTPQPNPAAPPGWYNDQQGTKRYWDGANWTEHTQPPPPSIPTPVSQPQDGQKNFWGWNPPQGLISPTAPYSGQAITGFVLVMAAILFGLTRTLGVLALPLDIAGIIVGNLAMRNIRTTRQRGYRLAFAAHITGILAILLPLVFALFAVIIIAATRH